MANKGLASLFSGGGIGSFGDFLTSQGIQDGAVDGYKLNNAEMSAIQDSYNNLASPSTSGGLNIGNTGSVLGGIGDLANAWTGYQQLGLAKKAFNFNRDMKEKEYAMAKDAYDRQVNRANSIGSQMQAGRVG